MNIIISFLHKNDCLHVKWAIEKFIENLNNTTLSKDHLEGADKCLYYLHFLWRLLDLKLNVSSEFEPF